MSEFHFGPYVHLAGLTPTGALISWGGFYFRSHNAQKSQEWLLVDDEELDQVQPSHKGSIGERSGSCRGSHNRFRTFPSPDQPAPLTFAVLGNFGIGIRTRSDAAQRQHEVAAALERAVAMHDVRLILTAGDNIYLDKQGDGDTGDEDDDWFFSFYQQPYRYILNHIPFYSTVGNHDSSDTEKSDDWAQLEGNSFLAPRFVEKREASRASSDPGLFYAFRDGADIQFVCIDTTLAEDQRCRFFELSHHLRFIE